MFSLKKISGFNIKLTKAQAFHSSSNSRLSFQQRQTDHPSHISVTGYRLLVTLVTLILGAGKLYASFQPEPVTSNTLDFLIGVLIAIGAFWLQIYGDAHPESLPSLFVVEYNQDIVFIATYGILPYLAVFWCSCTSNVLVDVKYRSRRQERITTYTLLTLNSLYIAAHLPVLLAVSSLCHRVFALATLYVVSYLLNITCILLIGFGTEYAATDAYDLPVTSVVKGYST